MDRPLSHQRTPSTRQDTNGSPLSSPDRMTSRLRTHPQTRDTLEAIARPGTDSIRVRLTCQEVHKPPHSPLCDGYASPSMVMFGGLCDSVRLHTRGFFVFGRAPGGQLDRP
jgi:hypothetical protein